MKTTFTKPKTERMRIQRGSSLKTPRRSSIGPVIELVPSLLAIKSILVPIDFSATSKKALQYALPFAEQFGAQIILLHVVEPVATPDFAYFPLMMENEQVNQACKAELDLLCRQSALPAKLIEKTLVRKGVAFQEITEAARALKVDLIILTTHGHTGLKHVVLGSTAERVVRHAPCPVLIVREKEHEFVARSGTAR
jgi:nucleotide-binding universal stress UspA family protein